MKDHLAFKSAFISPNWCSREKIVLKWPSVQYFEIDIWHAVIGEFAGSFKLKQFWLHFVYVYIFTALSLHMRNLALLILPPPPLKKKVLLYSPYVSVLKITRQCFLLECDGWFFKNRVFCIGERLSFNSSKDKLFTEGHNLCLNFTIRLVHPPCICFVVRLDNKNLQKWLKSIGLFGKLLLKSKGYSSILKVNMLEYGINPEKMLVFLRN